MVVFDILSTSVDFGFKRSRVRVRPGDVLVYDVVGLYGGGVDLQLRRVHILVRLLQQCSYIHSCCFVNYNSLSEFRTNYLTN